MTQPNPRLHVVPPSFTPLPFGLLSALGTEIRSPVDSHWQLGVTYEPLCADADTTFDPCFAVTGTAGAPAPAPPAKVETASLDRRGATAFTVFAEVDCSAVGFWDRAQELTERALAEAEEAQVEETLWTGVAGGQPVAYPHLAANATVIDRSSIVLQTAATQISGAAVFDIVEGLGELERALANCYHGVGVVHVPRSLAPAMADAMLLVREGPRYRTPNGNIVVLGSGYTGSSPAGVSTDGSDWIYATGSMFIYRGGVTTTPPISTLDRTNNDVKVIAERTYVIGWDCCHLAINISTGGVDTGTAGAA